jgi:splicing factor 3B subunit 1
MQAAARLMWLSTDMRMHHHLGCFSTSSCRILYKLDELVRPYVHKILVVIEPLLIDEDYYARVEGREIIANLSKAAGLAQMIAAMRPDIDNIDEYVRNTTARAFR